MSSIDNRIVRMQFDNEQFERGVMQSMRTLDELNEKLQFKEAGKGISALQVHLNNVDFSGIQNAVQHINHSFTSMTGMVAQRIKEDIVDNVINAAKRLEQVTLGQIKSGGKARAQNIANAKFMIEGLKFDWEAVKQAADYAVTDTAYGLDAAAKAASQLAASGVDFQETIETVNGQDLTQMHKSLRAISGVAAMTNASYEEISHIFTSVAGMGKLTAMQMNQLSLRGLNIASTIAQETGKTEQEIREMVSKGQISFQMFADAMDSAYGEHAKDANKTFEGSLSNLKAALSRIGAIFQQPVIDKTNTFFVSVTKRIKEFQAALNDTKGLRVSEKGLKKLSDQASKAARAAGLSGAAYEQFVERQIESNKKLMLENQKSLENGDVEEYSISRFATHFAEAWEAAVNFASKVVETLDLSWFQSIGGFLDKAAQKATNFFNAASKGVDKVKKSVDKASSDIADNLELDMNDLDLLHRILKNEFGYVEERWAKLDKIYKEQGSTKTGKWLQGYMDQLAGVGYRFEELGLTEEEFKKKQEDLAKSEAQRVSEMTKEELVVEGISNAIVTAKKAMDGIKRTIGNLIKSFGNVVMATGKVLASFRAFSTGLRPEDLTERVAKISDAILNLTNSIQPSEETLSKIMVAAQNVGIVFNDITEFVSNTVVAFIDFVSACISADESLDELAKNESLTSLQRVILDVMRVVDNLRRFFVNLGKIVVKTLKSVKTAFTNVFGGKEVGGALTAITGGVNFLAEGLANVTEKIAESELPFTIIEHIFGAIFLVIQKISGILGSITTGIRKFRNGTEDTIEVADKALKAGEKGSSFFEGLGKKVGKGIEWIKELPSKLYELWEAIKQQEGVKKLRKSIEDLWDSIKNSFGKGMEPVTKNVEEFTRATGGEGETLIGKLATGIGNVADKISGFLDKLPGYWTEIKTFFENIGKWFDKTIKDLHLDDLGEGISGAFSDIFTSDDSIFDKVKKFAERIFDEIVKTLSNVDWKEVGKGGMMALVAANLFNFFKATSGISEAIQGIKEIPHNIAGVIKSLGKFFGVAQKSLAKATNAYVLANAAKVILAMAAAIVMLKDIPKDDLNKALAAISFMGFVLYIIMKGIGFMAMGQAAKSEKIIDNSTKNLLQINSSLGKFAGIALMVFAVGGAVWLIGQAIHAIAESSTHGKGSVSAAIQAIKTLIIIVGGIAAGLVLLAKINIGPLGDGSKPLLGIGVALIGIGAVIMAMVGAITILSKVDISGNAIIAVIGIVSSIVLMTYMLGTVARWADPKALLALALDMVVMSIALGIIGAEIVGIAALMAVANLTHQGDVIMTAVAAMSITMLAMGLAFLAMGKGLSRMKRPSDMIGPLLAMAAVIAVLGWTLKSIAESTKNNQTGTVVAFFAIIAVLGMIATTLEKTVNAIRTGDSSTKAFMALAAVFAAVGVCLYMLADAVSVIAKAHDAWTVVGVLAALVAVCLAMGAITKSAKNAGGTVVADTLSAMAISFVAIGASLLLMAEAAKVMSEVNPWAFAGVIGMLVLMVGAFAVLGFFAGRNPLFAEGLKATAEAFTRFGIGMLMVSAAALIFGVAMGVMAAGIGKLAEGIGVLAQAFHDHWLTVVVLLGVLALMTFLVVQLVRACEPVAKLVVDVADAVVNTAGKAGDGLLNTLKGSGGKIAAWWKGVQPKTKAMIVTGIGTLCAAILKASPQLLDTAKALLGKLIGFLIDVIPDLVKGIIAVLIKLINALASEIRANSAKIAFAIWNLLEALFEVVLEVIGQMILMITGTSGPLGKIGQTIVDSMSESKGYLRKNLAEIEAYAEVADEEANEAMSKFLKKGAESGDIWAQTAIDMQEFKKELGDTTDAVDDHTDAMQTYFDAAAKGAKTRIPGIPIEVENVDYTGKFIGNQLGDGVQAGFDESDIAKNGLDFSGFNMDVDQGFMTDAISEGMEDSKTELYKETESTIQDGPVTAIEDSEPMIKQSTQEHVMDVMIGVVSDQENRNTLSTQGFVNGQYVVDGLVAGIDAGSDRIRRRMEQLGLIDVQESFIGPMQIDSPSKLFYDNGMYILMGLANGMAANESLVTDATTNLSESIINSFGDPLDYISQLASGELQYDPTIRPVLDSSNIGRGAGAINSMFRNQNVSLSGFSGQLAADIGQLDSRNSDVVEEIRALREEMAIMGEEISNMQVVMDTGALVGATAAPMDKALGQRAVRFGRGN